MSPSVEREKNLISAINISQKHKVFSSVSSEYQMGETG